MASSLKFILFIIGIIATLASILGLLITFGTVPAFAAMFPGDVRIYFGITLVCGLAALGASFSKTLY